MALENFLVKGFACLGNSSLVFKKHVTILIILLSFVDVASNNLSAFRLLRVLVSAN